MLIWPCPFLPADFVAYLNNMCVGDFVHVKSSVIGVVDVLVSVPVFFGNADFYLEIKRVSISRKLL